MAGTRAEREREFCIDNLLVRIHFIIVMIWWTGLAPWEAERQVIVRAASARKGNTLKGFKDFYVKDKTSIWP